MTEPVQLRRTAVGIVLVLASAAGFGAMAIFARIAYDHGADPHAVLLIRFTIAAAVLAAFMTGTGRAWPSRRDLRLLVAMGAVGYAGSSLAYFTALTRLPAGLAAVLFYTYPVLVAVCAAAITGRAPAPATMTAAVVATSGVALVAGPRLGGDLLGIALALLAAVVYGGYILTGSRLSAEADPLASTTTVCLAAASVYGIGWAVHTPHLPADGAGWSATVATAVVSTIFAVAAFFAGLRRLGGPPAAAVSSAEPVITTVLAFLVFGESLGWLQIVGAALVCSSVLAVAMTARPAVEKEPVLVSD